MGLAQQRADSKKGDELPDLVQSFEAAAKGATPAAPAAPAPTPAPAPAASSDAAPAPAAPATEEKVCCLSVHTFLTRFFIEGRDSQVGLTESLCFQ